MDLDAAHKAAVPLFDYIEKNARTIENEADTRFQIIDRIFLEVLGWPRSDIKLEAYSQAGYADYLLRINGANRFVIEAKRTGQLLVDTANPRFARYKVSGPALGSAMAGLQQAVQYCAENGADYAALTNGVSWISFLPFPSAGQSYRDRKAFVFPTAQSVLDNFSVFFDLFSRSGVVGKTYLAQFAKSDELATSQIEPMASVIRTDEVRIIPRSELASELEPLFREFFGTLSGDAGREMLIECFVETAESHFADANLEKMIRSISDEIEAIASSTGEQLLHEIEGAVATGHGEAVVIVGNKGAGKSTFIERFFQLVLAGEIRKKCLVVRVDMLDADGDPARAANWLTREFRGCLERSLFKDSRPTYDELQGLYYNEYQKWRIGQYRPLYETDKTAFKIKFGEFLNSKIEEDTHGYVVRLLNDVVANRKLLPCFVFDNADHHSQAFQDAVFQFSQSLQKAVPFTFVVMPITDRSLWRLSKSGPFQTYTAKTFYLPVPSPKRVLEKRIDYIRRKVAEGRNPGDFFVGRGIRLSIQNIVAFAASLEEVFVRHDFLARRINWLANNDIRRSLKLTQQVIISPYFSVDDLAKGYLLGVPDPSKWVSGLKFMQALVLGNHSAFQQEEQSFVVNVFSTSPLFPTTPLLKLRILKLLIVRAGEEGGGVGSYLSIETIHHFFESSGVSLESIDSALSELLEFRLVEPYDASDDSVRAAQRIAVSLSGRMHFDMAMRDMVYVAQMALATPLRAMEVVDAIRAIRHTKLGASEWARIRNEFITYCLKEDSRFIRLPSDGIYDRQRQLTSDLEAEWCRGEARSNQNSSLLESTGGQPQFNWSYITASVRWFNDARGFGFLDADLGQDVFVHASVLNRAGVESLNSGDEVVCDVARGADGRLQAIEIHTIREMALGPAKSDAMGLPGTVVFYSELKGYGFVAVPALGSDVYLPAKAIRAEDVNHLVQGTNVVIDVIANSHGNGYRSTNLRLA